MLVDLSGRARTLMFFLGQEVLNYEAICVAHLYSQRVIVVFIPGLSTINQKPRQGFNTKPKT